MGNAIKARIGKRQLQAFKDKVSGIRTAFGEREARETAEEVLEEMRGMILKGISPIKGRGRFPAYLHAGKKGKYPASVRGKYPAKRQRPVNLLLSGDFLRALTYRIYPARFGFGFEIGYFDKEEAKKEEGHATGWNGQPERPTIPGKGEEFAEKIQRIIFKKFKEAISLYVKRK